jgi:DNA-binding GntR family transcriptional regulator
MQLREQIISGRLKEGQFLRIDAIAKELKVSMTPVREGLLLLQSDSFVRLIPRRGFVVNSFSKDDLRDIFWAQATIAAELAERAASRMPNEDIERLEKMQVEYETAMKAGNERISTRLGHEFHRAINLSAESPRLALLLGNLSKQLPNRFYASVEGQLTEAAQYHSIILNAIKRRDAQATSSLMYRHITAGGEHLIAMLERQGLWVGSSQGKESKPAPAPAKAAMAKAPTATPRRPRARAASSTR